MKGYVELPETGENKRSTRVSVVYIGFERDVEYMTHMCVIVTTDAPRPASQRDNDTTKEPENILETRREWRIERNRMPLVSQDESQVQ